MSNFQCKECGTVLVDLGKEGYKTAEEIRLQELLQKTQNHYEAVVQQNKELQQELRNLKVEISSLLTTQAKELNGYEIQTFLGKPVEYWLQKDQQLEVFNDDYFNNLTYAQIAELAKKSIRLTKEHCSDLHKIEELQQKCKKLDEENQNLFNKGLELEGKIAVIKREYKAKGGKNE